MQQLLLTIITQNQTKQQAVVLATLLQITLQYDCSIDAISDYSKFENSYKIELSIILTKTSIHEINHLAINLSSKIASPWLVYFDDTVNTIELIFNKDVHSQIRKPEFQEIRWAHVQIVL